MTLPARPDLRRVLRSTSKGQSLLEFALVLPVLILLVFGIFDLGYAVFLKNMISNAAREGARTGIVKANGDAAIRARVRSSAPGLNLPDGQISIAPPSRTFNEPITVTVTYTYQPLTPIISSVVSSVDLSSTSVMYVEGVVEVP